MWTCSTSILPFRYLLTDAARSARREGFHRTLHISLGRREAWLKRSGTCEVVVLQTLSSNLFPDAYQLADVARMGGTFPACGWVRFRRDALHFA